MVIFNYLFKKNVTKHYEKVKKNVTNYVTTMKTGCLNHPTAGFLRFMILLRVLRI